MLVDFALLRGTPTFTIADQSRSYKRLYGAVHDRANERWLFPAYAPLGLVVIKDLQTVHPEALFSPGAQAQVDFLKSVEDKIAQRELPPHTFTTTPYAHQLEGLCRLYYYHRYALFWEAGVGKTKPVVDLMSLLKGQRALILTQRAVVENWVNEFERHSGGALKAAGLMGSIGQKRKKLAAYKEYNAIVASYGTARTLGSGGLAPSTMDVLRAAVVKQGISKADLKALASALRGTSDTRLQIKLLTAYLANELTLPQVLSEIGSVRDKDIQRLSDMEFDVIVADEGHYIKEITSQQSKQTVALSALAARRYILTATPTQGDPRHSYPLLRFLTPVLTPESFWEFSEKFLVRSPRNKHVILSYKNLHIINARIGRVSTKLTKAECLDLPDRTFVDIRVPLSAEQRVLYNTLHRHMEVDLTTFFADQPGPLPTLAIQNAATLLNKLSQITSGFLYDTPSKSGLCTNCDKVAECVAMKIRPYTRKCTVASTPPPQSLKRLKQNPKLEALDELLDSMLINESAKVIVWACFTPELSDICELLERKKLGYVRVDGSNSESVQDALATFSTPECRVYVAHIVTGIGITINQASYMVYYSTDWSLDHYEQSKDRNYRVGQTKAVTVYRLVCPDTVDQFKLTALDLKQDMSAILTTRMACAHCPRAAECLQKGIQLFDPACIYKTAVRKKTVKVKEV